MNDSMDEAEEVKDDAEILVSSPEAHVDILLTEFKQAGVMPNGFYDMAFNEETRRMLWAGQSPDGRRWDERMPEGQEAKPWDGAADARIPLVDNVVNHDAALLTGAFRKAELRATTVNFDQLELASGLSNYLHWLVHTKYKKAWQLEAELAAQFSREYAFAIAYVGWERELGKRRIKFTLQQLTQLCQSQPQGTNGQQPEQGGMGPDLTDLPERLLDPTQDAVSAEDIRAVYRMYVLSALGDQGFYEDELTEVTDLKLSLAKKYVKALREEGECEIPLPYVAKNGPLVQALKPYQDVLCARGTMMLQQSRAIFWRRWLTEAELASKRVEGWDEEWIKQVKATKGNISSWAGALGATSLTGPSTKTVGSTTYLKVTEENNPLIEVVYAYVKKVDEDGVTGVYETIFSPHITHDYEGQPDFCAKHTLIDYAHGEYPFVEFTRERMGRALTDLRSVGEVANTWQMLQKEQFDMLFNRSQWDTLPPIRVPKLGGTDYKLGPGAQVPLGKSQEIAAINLDAPPATLALELVEKIQVMSDGYFGQFNQAVHPALLAMKQEKMAADYFTFWGEVLKQVVSLTVQYNPDEMVTVTGNQALAQLDPHTMMEEVQISIEFDIKELNPDYLLQKLDTINQKILPGDVTGATDRAGLTAYQMGAVDPYLKQRLIQDQKTASQKLFEDVQSKVGQMMLGFEPQYVENDPTAPTKLQYLQQQMQSNPKIAQWMQSDERFKALLQNYAKNLQMSVEQQQNKQVGRIGVKPVAAAGAPGM